MNEEINYNRIKSSLEYMVENLKGQPRIDELARNANISEAHFERIFKEWAGISPKKFLEFITLNELKNNILTAENLIRLSETAGLSSQSRVYDLFVTIDSVTPQEYKTKGKGLDIRFGIHNTPFGQCFIANTSRGICALEFVDNNLPILLEHFHSKWQNAVITEDYAATESLVESIFGGKPASLRALLYGTPFQIKVWEALLKIPYGRLTSYSSVAALIGDPNAARAVGTAIGSNNIALLIPCHRVIQRLGGLGGYKWGEERKLSIIGYERSKVESANIF